MWKYRRLTEDEKEKIRKLGESGMSATEISRMLNIPRSTVYYHLHYYQKILCKRRDSDLEFKELVRLINSYEKGLPPQDYSERNIYVSILRHLYQNDRYGLRHKYIKRRLRKEGFEFEKWEEVELSSGYKVTKEIEGVLTFKLKKLRERGLVEYNEERYFLTDKGRELCKYLFEEKMQKGLSRSIRFK